MNNDVEYEEPLEDEEESRPKKRIIQGTKKGEFYKWEKEGHEAYDDKGLLANQEYIQEKIRLDCTDLISILALPTYDDGTKADKMPWLYEHFRQFLTDISKLLVFLGPTCTKDTCPTMQASEMFRYRCAAHPKPKNCHAMNYAIHTLDAFTKTFVDPLTFPSRFNFNFTNPNSLTNNDDESENNNTNNSSGKKSKKKKNKKNNKGASIEKCKAQYKSCARRVYRIFAHAYHHHEEQFIEYEKRTWLCSRFMSFVKMYKLIPMSHLKNESQISPSVLHVISKSSASASTSTSASGGGGTKTED